MGNFFSDIVKPFKSVVKPLTTIVGAALGATAGPLGVAFGASLGAFGGSVLSGGNRNDHLRSAITAGVVAPVAQGAIGVNKLGYGAIGSAAVGGAAAAATNYMGDTAIQQMHQAEAARQEQLRLEREALEAAQRARNKVQQMAINNGLMSVSGVGTVEYVRSLISQRPDPFRVSPTQLRYLTNQSRVAHGKKYR